MGQVIAMSLDNKQRSRKTAQTEVEFLNALGNKEFAKLDRFLGSTISFCIADDQKKISNSNTVAELKAFLSNKDIQKFKILHNGRAADKSSSYRVARMKTSNGTYRIFAYAESVGGTPKVVEVRIDPM